MARGKAVKDPYYRLVGYARVSTDDQSLTLQTEALSAAGVLPDNMHAEKRSGANRARQSLELAIKDCRAGDTLVVWKLDRLTRSVHHLYQILERLQEKGVGFRSLTEAIDTTTPAGRLIMGVLAVIAQFERDLTSERTAAGIRAIKAKRAKGETWNWGRKPVLTPAKLKRAEKMVAAGKSGPEIANKLFVSTPTIYAVWKKNPKWKRGLKGVPRLIRKSKKS